MLLILDWQHTGKPSPSKVDEQGAEFDLDGDGTIHSGEREVGLTGPIMLAAASRFRELGGDVICMADGWYSDRHDRANDYARRWTGPVVYVALHLNAATRPGTCGIVGHDYRSAAGPVLASSVAGSLEAEADELSSVRVEECRPGQWTEAMHNTIAGVYTGRAVGLCYEPAFLNEPTHAPLFREQGLRRLGCALANGIHRWGAT